MAFVVEDGTSKADATSYVTVAFADTYADSFFSSANYQTWSAFGDNDKERFLNRATKYLDRTYSFHGERATTTQALEFPRDYLYDIDGEEVTDIPTVLQEAVVLVAKRLMAGTELDPDMDRGGAIKRQKVDVIDITYSDGASAYKKFPEIDNILKASGYIKGNRNRMVNVRLIPT